MGLPLSSLTHKGAKPQYCILSLSLSPRSWRQDLGESIEAKDLGK